MIQVLNIYEWKVMPNEVSKQKQNWIWWIGWVMHDQMGRVKLTKLKVTQFQVKIILMSKRVKTVFRRCTCNAHTPQICKKKFHQVMICTNLYKREVQNHWYSAAKNGVGTKLCRVSHTIMATITCYDDPLSDAFHLVQHLFWYVCQYSWIVGNSLL